MTMEKKRNSLTKAQLEQVKAVLAETPDISLTCLIEKLSLTITLSGLCHRLKRANIPYNERSNLTREQNSQLMEALAKNPETPLDELIEELSLPITPYKLRRKLIRDGIWPNAGTVLTKAPTEQTQQVPLSTKPYIFIGRKPAAILFGEERVDVLTWVEAYTVIIKRCNSDPDCHERLMYLRNKAGGKFRVFLSDKPDGMRRPVEIDDNLYGECHYGSEALMHILVNQILAHTNFDCSNVSIIIKR